MTFQPAQVTPGPPRPRWVPKDETEERGAAIRRAYKMLGPVREQGRPLSKERKDAILRHIANGPLNRLGIDRWFERPEDWDAAVQRWIDLRAELAQHDVTYDQCVAWISPNLYTHLTDPLAGWFDAVLTRLLAGERPPPAESYSQMMRRRIAERMEGKKAMNAGKLDEIEFGFDEKPIMKSPSGLMTKPVAELEAELEARKPEPAPEPEAEPEPEAPATKAPDLRVQWAIRLRDLHGANAGAVFARVTGHATWQAALDAGLSDEALDKLLNDHLAAAQPQPEPEAQPQAEPAAEPTVEPQVEPQVEPVAPPAPPAPISEWPKNGTGAIERVQPNRFWLTSPAWQIDPFRMAEFIARSALFTNANTPERALAIMFKGVELGVSPFVALEHVAIINGKPTVDGALMLALLRKEGISVAFLERTDTSCTVKMVRPDNGDSITVTYTMQDAAKAGLLGKQSWKAFPRAMLTWRATSEAARLIASDIMLFGGIPSYTHEEIAPDGLYDEDGRPIG